MNITDFDSLLQAAKKQPQPQRLLFVFLNAELPKDANARQVMEFEMGMGGNLRPVMCVDKSPNELTNFDALEAESAGMGQAWSMMLVGALSGRNGMPPSDQEVEKALKNMIQAVEGGQDLSCYLAMDRKGLPIQFG
jgi:hypothetical protein